MNQYDCLPIWGVAPWHLYANGKKKISFHNFDHTNTVHLHVSKQFSNSFWNLPKQNQKDLEIYFEICQKLANEFLYHVLDL